MTTAESAAGQQEREACQCLRAGAAPFQRSVSRPHSESQALVLTVKIGWRVQSESHYCCVTGSVLGREWGGKGHPSSVCRHSVKQTLRPHPHIWQEHRKGLGWGLPLSLWHHSQATGHVLYKGLSPEVSVKLPSHAETLVTSELQAPCFY